MVRRGVAIEIPNVNALALDDFVCLQPAFKNGCLHVSPQESFDSFAFARGEWRPSHQLKFVHHSGRHPCDFVTTGYPGVRLISERLVDLMKRNRLSGWNECPVQVFDEHQDLVPGLYALQVIGRCGGIDTTTLPRAVEIGVDGVTEFPVWKGLLFDLYTWDGSDIFIPESIDDKTNSHLIASNRVKRLFDEHKITNINCVPVKEMTGSLPRKV